MHDASPARPRTSPATAPHRDLRVQAIVKVGRRHELKDFERGVDVTAGYGSALRSLLFVGSVAGGAPQLQCRSLLPVTGLPTGFTSTVSGAVVGLVLGLVGGGGSILAVPLLVYVVGVTSPHIAIGTSAVAVSLSAAGNVMSHARAGNVKWRCAAVFAVAGVLGAIAGSVAAQMIDGQKLLALFGLLMIGVGLAMLRKRSTAGDPHVQLSLTTAGQLLPPLLSIGFAVGLLSGFFGIGGGFLIVPGLMFATGIPLTVAIGTSLVAVAAFGAATATSYALSGLIDWSIAGLFVLGGLVGGIAGVAFGKMLSAHKRALNLTFAGLVIVAGFYVVVRGLLTLTAA